MAASQAPNSHVRTCQDFSLRKALPILADAPLLIPAFCDGPMHFPRELYIARVMGIRARRHESQAAHCEHPPVRGGFILRARAEFFLGASGRPFRFQEPPCNTARTHPPASPAGRKARADAASNPLRQPQARPYEKRDASLETSRTVDLRFARPIRRCRRPGPRNGR